MSIRNQEPALSVETSAVIARFNDAFGRLDADAVMSLMTDDCVFENTFPAPDGERHVGAQKVGEFWRQFFASTPSARFEAEETVVFGDRAVVRWIFHWENDGGAGHVRGIDLFRVRNGKVAEKLSYVKG
jgi:ketosteroid isomerase-like protein